MIFFLKGGLPEKTQKTSKHNPIFTNQSQVVFFDYIEPKSNALYYISFRIVKFTLPNRTSEIIYTNLPKEDFSIDELRDLYNLRWGIETSFRDIKYATGLLFSISKIKTLYCRKYMQKSFFIILVNWLLNVSPFKKVTLNIIIR